MTNRYDGSPILRLGNVAFYSCRDKFEEALCELHREAKDKELAELWDSLGKE